MTISPADLLSDLENRGARIYLADGRLRVVAPKDALNEELREELRRRREEIVDLLRDREAAWNADSAAPPIIARERDGVVPLSFAQQRLWFLDQLEPGSVEYNVPLSLRLEGPLDAAALSAALDAIVERHEVLRTRLLTDEDGVAHQVVDPSAGFGLGVVDLTGEPDGMVRAQEMVAADAVAPFDLAVGPLFRGRLIRLGSDDHVLSLCLHHVVSDEWSAAVLRRELTMLYEAFSHGEPSPLAPLAVQYGDFAVWQRDWLQGEVLEGQLGYWRERLEGASVLELPTDRPRPAVRSSAGAKVEFEIPEKVVAGLRAVTRETGATMFMTLMSAFTVLLGKYAGQDDVVVGTPIANRNRAEVEDLIGYFVNTLVLRTDLSGDPTFAELVGRVRRESLGAYAHQDMPFEQLVDALTSGRDRSRTPLFQVLFNYDQDAMADGGDVGLDTSAVELPVEVTAKFDLTLFLIAREHGFGGSIEFSTELFDRSTVERMVGHLTTLLQAVADGSSRRLSELSVLGVEERRRVVVEWNDTAVVVPSGGVHEWIATWALLQPGATAVVSGDGSLTYAELEVRANRLAHHLRGVGVGPEVVVGLCLPRGVDLVVALLAVWKAGGAYLPLDVEFPAERLAFMLADSRVSVLVGDSATLDELPVGRVRLVALDDPLTAMLVGAAPESAPVGVTRPEQVAYVMYTSGSTGRPKGVQVTHGGLAAYVHGVRDRVGLGGDGARYALLQSLVTDFGNTVVFSCLVSGGTLYVPGAEVVRESAALRAYLAGNGVDYVKIVPSQLVALAGEEGLAGLVPARTLVLGGEASPVGWARELVAAAAGGRVVVNHYGPTETTVGVAATRVGAGQLGGSGSVPIGRPLPNSRLYVLDRFLTPVPVGVPGELFIGGLGVARGYVGRPELTAERFVADPFASDGSRLYRSGDRVRWLPDGELEFLGRVDHQVKIRGFRVEPGEVETVLRAHPAIETAVVVAREDGGDRRLVAYLVPADLESGMPSTSELRAFLLRSLPEYLVPAVFVELAAVPLTSNGKLDRAALPAPESVRPELGVEFAAPRTPAEEILAGVWAEVLGLERVGVGDNFFELGG
ncbi:amino acid adenylation domain-containing protein, partial [Streptosporangium subroseum]|uniref:amino acid adenylation domain-containing protein n=1 Tax=Streptosporangium subroseum TaxID=106412 RepID=UPI00342CE1FB